MTPEQIKATAEAIHESVSRRDDALATREQNGITFELRPCVSGPRSFRILCSLPNGKFSTIISGNRKSVVNDWNNDWAYVVRCAVQHRGIWEKRQVEKNA